MILSWSYPQRGEWQGKSLDPERLHWSFFPPPICNHLLPLYYPGITRSMKKLCPQTKTVTVTKKTMTHHDNYHTHWPLTNSRPSGIEWKWHNVLLRHHHLCTLGHAPDYSCTYLPGLESKDMTFCGFLFVCFPYNQATGDDHDGLRLLPLCDVSTEHSTSVHRRPAHQCRRSGLLLPPTLHHHIFNINSIVKCWDMNAAQA